MITPDGQPVGWALNSLYKTGLDDRVYGPEMMMLRVYRRAAQEDVAVYFYGSTREVLDNLQAKPSGAVSESAHRQERQALEDDAPQGPRHRAGGHRGGAGHLRSRRHAGGAQELNRMCGSYAPEKKELEQKDGRDRVRRELALMSRFAALVPRPRLHLIRFHGVLAPNAKLRAEIIPSAPSTPTTP